MPNICFLFAVIIGTSSLLRASLIATGNYLVVPRKRHFYEIGSFSNEGGNGFRMNTKSEVASPCRAQGKSFISCSKIQALFYVCSIMPVN